MTLNLESGLLSRAEPLCGAIAPFTEVRFPNILHTAKANICSDILGCSKFPEMMHYCIGISIQWPKDEKEVDEISEKQLEWLLEGLEIEQKKAHHPVDMSAGNNCF